MNLKTILLSTACSLALATACSADFPSKSQNLELFYHQGLHSPSRPSNSLSALELSTAERKNGKVGVELDVHLSGDGELVIHHDATIKGRFIALNSVKTLKAVDKHLATLPEFLKQEPLPVIIELKPNIIIQSKNVILAQKLVELLLKNKQWQGYVTIASFDPSLVTTVRENLVLSGFKDVGSLVFSGAEAETINKYSNLGRSLFKPFEKSKLGEKIFNKQNSQAAASTSNEMLVDSLPGLRQSFDDLGCKYLDFGVQKNLLALLSSRKAIKSVRPIAVWTCSLAEAKSIRQKYPGVTPIVQP